MAAHLHKSTFKPYLPSSVEKHHREKTFREEYPEFLEKFEEPYEERFFFEWLEE